MYLHRRIFFPGLLRVPDISKCTDKPDQNLKCKTDTEINDWLKRTNFLTYSLT